jgi:PST family polysaccharide transporter
MKLKKIREIFSGQFIQNVGWMGGAELFNRIFRLATTVTLARTFSAYDYGLTAVIFTVVEFANVFTLRKGIGAKIIQAEEGEILVISNTSYWLNWMLCLGIFVLQLTLAFPISLFYGSPELVWPICASALMYLMMPFYLIHAALIQRENRLKVTALCQVLQSLVANAITVILALLGMGVWAVVWPMILTTPIWIIVLWRYHPWRPPQAFSLHRWQEIVHFGGNLLGVHLLQQVRNNIDYLIIGRGLGMDALGLYYFAFNAGFGISRNVISAFTSALFPYLCQVQHDIQQLKVRYFSSLKKTFSIIIPFIALQAGLAPFYVPLVFGEKWTEGIPILILICLSVLPFSFSIFTNDLLNTVGKTKITLYLNLIYTCIFGLTLLICVRWGILAVAAGVLLSQLVVSPIFGIWAIAKVFKKDSPLVASK